MERTEVSARALPTLAKSGPSALRRALAALWSRRLLMGLIGCYLAAGFAWSLLIPPWQSPDEPAHFAYARSIAPGAATPPAIQRAIIASFYRYRFWEYRGMDPPEIAPSSFGDINRLIIPQTDKTPFYYWLAAGVSSWTDDVTLQLYSMRWLSVLLSALTIPITYLVAREVLPPTRSKLALAAAGTVAFLPMYGYIGASVNPDTIGAPLGAMTIWLAARGLRGKQPGRMAVSAVLCALLAFWARRSTIALIPWALLLAAVWAVGYAGRLMPRVWVAVASLAAVLLVVAGLAWPSQQASMWYSSGAQQGPTRSDRFAYAGGHSLRIAGQAQPQPAMLFQVFALPQLRKLANHTVIVQAFVRSGGAQIPGQLQFDVAPAAFSRDKLSMQAGPVRHAAAPFVATSTWQPVTLRVKMPEFIVSANLRIALGQDGELFVDQVQLLDGATMSDLGVLGNGGGEDALRWWQQRYSKNQVVQYLTRILQGAHDGLYVSPAALALYPYFLGQMFDSLIGRFGWMSIAIPSILIYTIGAIWLGLLLAVAGVWRRASGFDPARRRVLLWLLLLIIFTIISIFLEYTSYLYADTYPQGRYLFPVLAAIASLLISGLAQLLPARHDRAAVALVLVLLLALDLWSWGGVILPAFYG